MNIIKLIILIVPLILTSCGNHFELANYRFRVNGAPFAPLGALGYKNSSGGNTFDPHSRPDLTGIPIVLVDQRYLSTEGERKIAAKVTGVYDIASGTAEASNIKNAMEEGNYQVFALMDRDLLIKRLLSLPRDVVEPIYHAKGRIVTAVVIVGDHKATFSSTTKLDLKGAVVAKIVGTKENPEVTLTYENGKEKTIRIADGYSIGYETARFQWDETPGGKRLLRIKADKIGFDVRR